VNVFRVHPVGAAAASLYFSLTQIDGHEGAATVAASCSRFGFLSQPACRTVGLIAVRPTAGFAVSVLRQVWLSNCTGQTMGVASSMKDVNLSLPIP